MGFMAALPYLITAGSAAYGAVRTHRANDRAAELDRNRANIRRSLINALANDYPQLRNYPGLLQSAMWRQPSARGSVWDDILGGIGQMGKQYVGAHPEKYGVGAADRIGSPTSSSTGTQANGQSDCPPGTTYFPGYEQCL